MDHVAALRHAFDLFSAGDIEGFVDGLAEDFVDHEPMPGIPPTKAGTKEVLTVMRAGFPDMRFDVEDILADGDKVVARLHVTGTQTGSFVGIPATGRKIDVAAIDIVRFADDGLAHEHWGVMDVMSIMQQLGVAPEGMPG
jgi:steroid delta-isomerase-like uncharacterized protein